MANRRSYKSKYVPVHPHKYKGDPTDIICRSSWERAVCKWADFNSEIVGWGSETICVPYICKTDGRAHRYFTDFCFKLKSGKVLLVEVKPKHETSPPNRGKRKTKLYTEQVMTYAKNASKWNAAMLYCKARGWEFRVWTEDTLDALKIKTL